MRGGEMKDFKLSLEELIWKCDPSRFDTEQFKELEELEFPEFFGQDRAIKALEVGLSAKGLEYNMFVVTDFTGIEDTKLIKQYVSKTISAEDQEYRPSDWIYGFNFLRKREPQIIELPSGWGKIVEADLEKLPEELKKKIPEALTSDKQEKKRKEIWDEGQKKQKELFTNFAEKAKEEGFLVQLGDKFGEMWLGALKSDGTVYTDFEFAALSPEEKKKISTKRAKFFEETNKFWKDTADLIAQTNKRIAEADRQAAEEEISFLFPPLLEKYKNQEFSKVRQYLEDLKTYTLDNLNLFMPPPKKQTPQEASENFLALITRGDPFLPFKINVFVDNSDKKGPPVITEPHPNWNNLFGKIERRQILSMLFTDHTSLRAGSVHYANGGYLILNARDLILASNGWAWEGLKKVIKHGKVKLQDLSEEFVASHDLRPQPMPIEFKVILCGNYLLYYLLSKLDPEFLNLFKVKVDFDSKIDRNEKTLRAYGSFVQQYCKENNFLSFDSQAIAKVVEYGARLAEDQTKLSSNFQAIRELIRESDFWARKEGHKEVQALDIRKALKEKEYRLNLTEEKLQEAIKTGTHMIDIKGKVVGQVNGIVGLQEGEYKFTIPSRITAKVFKGKGEVINIERKIERAGAIVGKGHEILAGFFKERYGRETKLNLDAQTCFEQVYGEIEGDSATIAELAALVSEISGIPVRQDTAVTGSMNQLGDIQPIGIPNEKIEGFFKTCKKIGITGSQGVVIPISNKKHLMLDEEVVEACEKGEFRVIAVKRIEEALEYLLDTPMVDIDKAVRSALKERKKKFFFRLRRLF